MLTLSDRFFVYHSTYDAVKRDIMWTTSKLIARRLLWLWFGPPLWLQLPGEGYTVCNPGITTGQSLDWRAKLRGARLIIAACWSNYVHTCKILWYRIIPMAWTFLWREKRFSTRRMTSAIAIQNENVKTHGKQILLTRHIHKNMYGDNIPIYQRYCYLSILCPWCIASRTLLFSSSTILISQLLDSLIHILDERHRYIIPTFQWRVPKWRIHYFTICLIS